MNFKIDENLPNDIVLLLSKYGFNADTVYDEDIAGCRDNKLITVCQDEKRILVTLDLDFSDIRTYDPEKYNGIIIIRLKNQDKIHILKTFKKIIPLLSQEEIDKKLWIVGEKRIRVR